MKTNQATQQQILPKEFPHLKVHKKLQSTKIEIEILKRQDQAKNVEQNPIHMSQCRICYDKDNQNKFIQPCACKGSVQYVHLKCMSQWVLVLLKQNNKGKQNNSFSIQCQMCKKYMKFKTSQQLKLICFGDEKGNKLLEKIKDRYEISILVLIILLFALGLLAYCLACVALLNVRIDFKTDFVQSIIWLVGILLSSILLLSDLIFFCMFFLLQKVQQIELDQVKK